LKDYLLTEKETCPPPFPTSGKKTLWGSKLALCFYMPEDLSDQQRQLFSLSNYFFLHTV